ncbi:MAG TPA: hypothetical protein VGC82_16905 [Rhodopila sp.]|jgi:hypothetical protein
MTLRVRGAPCRRRHPTLNEADWAGRCLTALNQPIKVPDSVLLMLSNRTNGIA